MSEDILAVLRKHYDLLNVQYEEHLEAVRELQKTLILQILPGLVDELDMDEDGQQYCLEWLEDSLSIFRTLRRHKFITSFALEALRDTLSWRLRVLRPLSGKAPSLVLHCLPDGIQDPLGRPMVALRLTPFCDGTPDIKGSFLRNMELLRQHLAYLNELQQTDIRPILQYVALLDIGGMTFHHVQQNIELLSWFAHEVVPRFPGMLSSVFVLNYSWAHTGLWNLAKRLLPATALERVFFPTADELKAYFSDGSLPNDLGGDLPPLSSIESPLHRYIASSSESPSSFNSSASSSAIPDRNDDTPPRTPPPRISRPKRAVLSATSLLNPFFGYPATEAAADGSTSAPTLRHGRRRKRDLLRTLLRLWWSRWRYHIKALLLLMILVLALWARRNRVRHR